MQRDSNDIYARLGTLKVDVLTNSIQLHTSNRLTRSGV